MKTLKEFVMTRKAESIEEETQKSAPEKIIKIVNQAKTKKRKTILEKMAEAAVKETKN